MLLRLVISELRHRWSGAALGLIMIAVATSTVLLVAMLAESGERQTRRIQRDIGLNVIILPPGTDIDEYWMTGVATGSMQADVMDRLVDQDVANRLVPMLKQSIEINGHQAMLVGLEDEWYRRNRTMPDVFTTQVPLGSVVLGSAIARSLGAGQGDVVQVLGESMSVDRVLASTGTREDVAVHVTLADAQQLLDQASTLNEIQAIECHCAPGETDPLGRLRTALDPIIPGVTIIRREAAANARLQQRHQAERVLAVTSPLALLLCAGLVAALATMNMRERRVEIGLLHAVGRSGGFIGMLLLGRWIPIGLLGAVLGWVLAMACATFISPGLLPNGGQMAIPVSTFTFVLVLAPAGAISASAVPVAFALRRDPAEVLRSI